MIRRATPDDAEAIARVHVATWQFAYADIVPAELLGSRSLDVRVSQWKRLLDEGGAVWVAETEGRVVGFVCVEKDELLAMYVDPIAQGAGIGSALLAEAEQAGARRLTVLTDNGHARTFYEARSWTDAGEDEPYVGLPTRRYVKP